MDFLTLCQRTWIACALAGDGPQSVASANVMHESVVQWVKDAWIQIQNMHADWNFLTLRESGAPAMTIGQQEYVAGDFGMQKFSDLRHFWIQDNGVWRELRVLQEPVDWTVYWDAGEGAPSKILQAEDRTLWVDRIPDKAYPVRSKFMRTPQVLSADGDTPLLPEQYREAIVWKAVEFYGYYDQDSTMVTKGLRNFEQILRRMELTELPDWSFEKGELVQHARF